MCVCVCIGTLTCAQFGCITYSYKIMHYNNQVGNEATRRRLSGGQVSLGIKCVAHRNQDWAKGYVKTVVSFGGHTHIQCRLRRLCQATYRVAGCMLGAQRLGLVLELHIIWAYLVGLNGDGGGDTIECF